MYLYARNRLMVSLSALALAITASTIALADVITLPNGDRVAIDRWEDFVDDGPKQPKLGFDGTLVRVPGYFGKGMRINRVDRGSLAAKMGLERGDVIVAIEDIGFRCWDGYYQALRCGSQSPRIGIINVRTGKFMWCRCRLPHNEPTERWPDEPHSFYIASDPEHVFYSLGLGPDLD